jgi:hypothetical protein
LDDALMIYRAPQSAEPYAPTPSNKYSIMLGTEDGVHR